MKVYVVKYSMEWEQLTRDTPVNYRHTMWWTNTDNILSC